jgi:hypothetical protein
MVAYPNENKIVYGIVVRGNDSDPDPTMSGGVGIYCPTEYGPNVDIKHLPFSRTLAQGNQNGMTTSNPPPEHGSAVMCMKMAGHSGTGHLHVLGVIPNDINRDSTVPGNSIALWSAIANAISRDEAKIRPPPNAGSGPAGSKPPKEKGGYWKHELVKGIPSTATLWPISGMFLPQEKNITTAVQAFSGILTGDMLGKLPGLNMSIGSLFDFMPSELKDALFKELPPEIGLALNSMSNLLQSVEINEAGGFNTAAKINPDVFFKNAVDVLSNVRDIYGMVSAFQRLQYDTSLYGLESLPPIDLVMSGGPFGNIPMQLDALGNLTSKAPEPVQKLIEAFSSLMNNTSGGFPGVFPNQNMFGGSAGVMNELFNRLPTEELNKAVKQMQDHVAPGDQKRKNLIKILDIGMTAKALTKKALG